MAIGEKFIPKLCECGGLNYSYAVTQLTPDTARFDWRCEKCMTTVHSEEKPHAAPPEPMDEAKFMAKWGPRVGDSSELFADVRRLIETELDNQRDYDYDSRAGDCDCDEKE